MNLKNSAHTLLVALLEEQEDEQDETKLIMMAKRKTAECVDRRHLLSGRRLSTFEEYHFLELYEWYLHTGQQYKLYGPVQKVPQ